MELDGYGRPAVQIRLRWTAASVQRRPTTINQVKKIPRCHITDEGRKALPRQAGEHAVGQASGRAANSHAKKRTGWRAGVDRPAVRWTERGKDLPILWQPGLQGQPRGLRVAALGWSPSQPLGNAEERRE
jgi:hypothetical protein